MDEKEDKIQDSWESQVLSGALKKRCWKCKQVLDLSAFCKNRRNKDGHHDTCKSCSKEISKEYRDSPDVQIRRKEYMEKTRSKRILQKKEWDKKNAEYVKKASKIYYDNLTQEQKKVIAERANKYYHSNKEKISKRSKESRRNNRERNLLNKAKKRSRKFNLPFNLEISDIVIPVNCPILGIELSHDLGEANWPSIDKIIPELGYVKGNIQVISFKANTMKSNATVEELLAFARWFRGDGFKSIPTDVPPIARWYSCTKARAKSSGLPFDLSIEDFRLYNICPILGYPLDKHKGHARYNSATIDRILPELGYTKGNIQVISYKANTMKNDATPQMLLKFVEWIENSLLNGINKSLFAGVADESD